MVIIDENFGVIRVKGEKEKVLAEITYLIHQFLEEEAFDKFELLISIMTAFLERNQVEKLLNKIKKNNPKNIKEAEKTLDDLFNAFKETFERR